MTRPRNVLFIMADQLRADYLGCTGHPHIKTPNIDALAAEGVLFSNAYVQATVCGPSRMCFYTGRYMSSHGSTWNGVPLRVGEPTLGDHLRELGVRTALVGKTHMSVDTAGMKRLGVDPQSIEGIFASQCGFEPYQRDDGLHPDRSADPDLAYNRYLRDLGYETDNPWHSAANAGQGAEGDILSGWYMRNAGEPANVAEDHSETAYMTDRAMEFIAEAKDAPWCLHLSYIKPHWPYIAPAPYHDMYGEVDVIAPVRSEDERDNAHPVYRAYRQHEESVTFSRDEVRQTVIPVYMGLISQIDAHIGRLVAYLKEHGLYETTTIVLTSDHGDYLGDHWLGEKELFHEQSARVPLLIRDPDADATRGTVCDDIVQSIDLAPTFYEALGGDPASLDHILEGRSLAPILRGDAENERPGFAVAELDYTFRPGRRQLELAPDAARARMLRQGRWKYVQFDGYDPQLFDLETDPDELHDLGTDAALAGVREEMERNLAAWQRDRKMRITMSNQRVEERCDAIEAKASGVMIGKW